MGKVRSLLAQGTDKLGKTISTWSIPAVRCCPGRSRAVCEQVCYATHGRFVTATVKELMQWRLRQSHRKDFADRLVGELFRKGVLACRIHVAGDFYSPGYTAKWVEIVSRSRHCRFFCYTRSWRVHTIEPVLRALSSLDNLALWYSADSETGIPPNVPPGVRVAWLQTQAHEPVAGDLVFQVRGLRSLSLPLAVPVCPQETPQGKKDGVTCANCQICL